MHDLLPLMIVPLLIWIAVWGYLWTLDRKVKRLECEMARQDEDTEE
jgi:CcmD family protein